MYGILDVKKQEIAVLFQCHRYQCLNYAAQHNMFMPDFQIFKLESGKSPSLINLKFYDGIQVSEINLSQMKTDDIPNYLKSPKSQWSSLFLTRYMGHNVFYEKLFVGHKEIKYQRIYVDL